VGGIPLVPKTVLDGKLKLLVPRDFSIMDDETRQLKYPSASLWVVVPISWSIAFFEYCLAVPANRIGYGVFTLAQLKIIQEVITLGVFVPFSVFYMRQTIRVDFLWAALCMCGAAFFIFRSELVAIKLG
jgi:uncharacterized protein (DUF486 family)